MKKSWFAIVPLLAVALSACPTQPAPQSVVIAPATGLTLPVGAGQLLYATVTNSSGNTVQQAVSWASSDSSKASVGADGTIIGLALGETNITASAGGVTSAPVKVTVGKLTKGVVTLAAPTVQDPTATVQLPVVVYKDYALYQGDVIFALKNVQVASSGGWTSLKPQANIQPADRGKLWANRTVPYYLDPGLPKEIRDHVVQAAAVFNDKAGMTLQPLSSPGGDYVYISRADAGKPICGDSYVGRQGGRQDLHFQVGCPLRTYLHEFGHALGLWHEQSRNDRDAYIAVQYDNIVSDYTDQYDKSSGDGAGYGTYDYGSVMHYSVYNGVSKMSGGKPLPTFTVNRAFDSASEVTSANQIGNRDALSGGDLKALSFLYGNIAPAIALVQPKGTVNLEIGHPFGIDLEATVSDVEDGNACCKVTWYAWKEGTIGTTTGADSKINYQFKTLGSQLVTATVEDSKGATDRVNFAVNVTHAKPDAGISNPTPAATVYRNLPFQLIKLANSGQDAPWDVKCTWTIPGLSPNPTGCATSVLLGNGFPKGSLSITLNVTDKYGGTNSSALNVNVDELATLGASIVTPANNGSGSVNAGDAVTLEKAVINGVAPISRVWTWQPTKQGCAVQTVTVHPAVVIQPGTSPDGYWDLNDQLSVAPLGCGWGDGVLTVTITDKNGQTTSASINFRVDYAPPPN